MAMPSEGVMPTGIRAETYQGFIPYSLGFTAPSARSSQACLNASAFPVVTSRQSSYTARTFSTIGFSVLRDHCGSTGCCSVIRSPMSERPLFCLPTEHFNR